MNPASTLHAEELRLPQLHLRFESEESQTPKFLRNCAQALLSDRPILHAEPPEVIIKIEIRETSTSCLPLARGNAEGVSYLLESIQRGKKTVKTHRISSNGVSVKLTEEAGALDILLVVPSTELEYFKEAVRGTFKKVFDVLLPTSDLTPVRGALAQLVSEEETQQIFLFGQSEPIQETLSQMEEMGWEVIPERTLYLKCVDHEVGIFGASESIPEFYPTSLLGLSDAPELEAEDSIASAEAAVSAMENVSRQYVNAPSAFRKTFFRLQQSLAFSYIDEEKITEERMKGHLEILKDLSRSVPAYCLDFFHNDPEYAARIALMHLGLKEPRGWDLNPPIVYRRGPVAIPKRFTYWERI